MILIRVNENEPIEYRQPRMADISLWPSISEWEIWLKEENDAKESTAAHSV